MPVLSNDDQARRLRYVWLGPRGFRLPEARFPAWGMFLFLTFWGVTFSAALSPAGTRVWLLGVLITIPGALLLTRLSMRHVEHDRPVRYWIDVLLTELDTPRPVTTRTEAEVSIPTDLIYTGSHKR